MEVITRLSNLPVRLAESSADNLNDAGHDILHFLFITLGILAFPHKFLIDCAAISANRCDEHSN